MFDNVATHMICVKNRVVTTKNFRIEGMGHGAMARVSWRVGRDGQWRGLQDKVKGA